MTTTRSRALALALVAAGVAPCAQPREFRNDATITPLLERALPDVGRVGTMVMVEIPPGGQTDPHRHPGSHLFVYVVEGQLEMGIRGRPTVVLEAGDT